MNRETGHFYHCPKRLLTARMNCFFTRFAYLTTLPYILIAVDRRFFYTLVFGEITSFHDLYVSARRRQDEYKKLKLYSNTSTMACNFVNNAMRPTVAKPLTKDLTKTFFNEIKTVLFDADGVLWQGASAIPGNKRGKKRPNQ